MSYRFKCFEVGNGLSHQISKDNLAFITICFVLQQYELNLCDPSAEKEKCMPFIALTFMAWIFS